MLKAKEASVADAVITDDPNAVMALEFSDPGGPAYEPEGANLTHMVTDPFLKDPYEKELVEVKTYRSCNLLLLICALCFDIYPAKKRNLLFRLLYKLCCFECVA